MCPFPVYTIEKILCKDNGISFVQSGGIPFFLAQSVFMGFYNLQAHFSAFLILKSSVK